MSSRRGDHSDAVARAAGWASPSLQRARNVVVATGDRRCDGGDEMVDRDGSRQTHSRKVHRMAWSVSKRETIPSSLAHWADVSADKVCTWFEDQPVTYAEMEQRSTAVANSLAESGVRAGDTVGLLLSNCAEFAYIWFGAAKLGAVIVPINLHYKGAYLAHQLGTARTRIVVAEASLAGRVVDVATQLPDMTHLFVRVDADTATLLQIADVHVAMVDELLAGDPNRLSVPRLASWDDPSVILFTSGTTGPSKGGVATQNYLIEASRNLYLQMGGTEHDVSWSPLPLFHANAMCKTVLGPLLFGATGALDKKFSVSRFWESVHKFDATMVSILGSLLQMMWNQPESDLERNNPIRALHSVPIPKEIHRGVETRWNVTLFSSYGLGEAFPVINTSIDDPAPPGSAGKPLDSFEVRLFDDDDHEVAVGEVGEFVVRPTRPHVMFEGYFNNPEATVQAWRNLWFHTGDFGRKDDNGFFAFVDRKKDALRYRGENISSFEVENAINTHPVVAESAVYAVPSEFSEDEVMVTLSLKPGKTLDMIEFMGHCERNLPYFSVPRFVAIVEDFDRNPSGKILKNELRETGITDGCWDREVAGYKVRR